MEELFRMLLVRAPEAVDRQIAQDDILDLSNESQFQDRLRGASTQRDRVRIANDFARTEGFIGSASDVTLGPPLVQLADRFSQAPPGAAQDTDELLLATGEALRASVESTATAPFGDAQSARIWLNALVGSPDWKTTTGRLKDSIL